MPRMPHTKPMIQVILLGEEGDDVAIVVSLFSLKYDVNTTM